MGSPVQGEPGVDCFCGRTILRGDSTKTWGSFEFNRNTLFPHLKTTRIMDQQKVDMFLMTNSKFFQSRDVMHVREQLLQIDDSAWPVLQTLSFKDPTMMLIVSILAGSLGIDRFLIGDTGLGIAKLLTCGGLGIWAIVDWFLIMDATKEKNFQKIQDTFFM